MLQAKRSDQWPCCRYEPDQKLIIAQLPPSPALLCEDIIVRWKGARENTHIQHTAPRHLLKRTEDCRVIVQCVQ